ncbi:MAG: D-lyxose/D-mannose family sugar isomerase [Opitutaceae bacterium]|nr:D-lyxose/D-mannose family sugar isomerase [Opitutaceae bacterium]
MKRSKINALINEAKSLLHRNGMRLPPFAYWSPADWKTKGSECDEIRRCGLGWDITDFGSGDFERIGLVVFTVRNGHKTLAPYKAKTYCEKILIVGENQRTPMHYHAFKQEDIICRCGGNLICQVYQKGPDGKLADADVEVSLDGVRHRVKAGTKFVLQPGESVTLSPFMYHEFWAEVGTGTSIVGEVSKVNDDATDNFFLNAIGRFPKIEEDEPPVHLLCTEY